MRIKATIAIYIVGYAFSVQYFKNTTRVVYAGVRVNGDTYICMYIELGNMLCSLMFGYSTYLGCPLCAL